MKTLKWLVGLFNCRTRTVAYRPDESVACRVGLRFDLTNPEAVRWAATSSVANVAGINDDTRAALRQILVRGFREGNPPARMAREIEQIVGLDKRRQIALETFRSTQFDRDVQAHPKTSVDVIRERVEARVERYRQRLLRDRANTIAHTETIQASSVGQRTLWREAQAQGYLRFDSTLPTQYQTPLGPSDGPTLHVNCRCGEICRVVDGIARRFWITAPDACDDCAAVPGMNEEGIGLGEEEGIGLGEEEE